MLWLRRRYLHSTMQIKPILFAFVLIFSYLCTMEEFKIKAYGIAELAAKYSPDSADSTARKKLNQQLTALGFRPKARIFTPAQVRAIVEALGEP